MSLRHAKIDRAALSTNRNYHLRVVNVAGTSGLKCRCLSWLEHWQGYGGGPRQRRTCVRLGCTNDAIVGAHVKIDDLRHRQDILIAPLCSACNNWRNTSAMYIDSRSWLAYADPFLSCQAL